MIVIRSALANQLDWTEIKELIAEAAENGDPVVSRIKNLKQDTNQMTMLLAIPYSFLDEEGNESLSDSSENNNSENDGKNKVRFKEEDQDGPLLVDLDIDLTAQANARKYYDKKRTAATKENKTIQSHSGAIKSAERRAKQDMRDANAISRIIKARKVFWFEKFLWFISSENYFTIRALGYAVCLAPFWGSFGGPLLITYYCKQPTRPVTTDYRTSDSRTG